MKRILVLQNLSLYGSTRKYYLFKCPKRRTLVLISNLSYTHTGVPVGTTEFILIRSLYGGTRRYYRTHTYSCISDLILVFQILFLYFRSYTCIIELILVLRNSYLRYRVNSCISDTEVPVGTTEHFIGTKVPVGTTEQIHYTEVPVGTTGLILILVFRILYLSYRAYTYFTDLILALRNMYLSYGSYTCFTEHILVPRILYRAYSGTKVPVGTT